MGGGMITAFAFTLRHPLKTYVPRYISSTVIELEKNW